MKNKIELKKYLLISILTIFLLNVYIYINSYISYGTYTRNVNAKINGIFEEVVRKYPNVDKNEIMKILNNSDISGDNILLKEYGIDIDKDSIVLSNDLFYEKNLLVNLVVISGFCFILVGMFLYFNYKKDNKIKEITNYIEEINRKNYSLKIDTNTEDELSILQNELYKVTIMLKEQAENSMQDKLSLKDSLADISHQLKTPLTSISIMLDNILDDEDMDDNIRNEFIRDIRSEIQNINVLVNSILKLSKFDTNTITLNKKEEELKNIFEECKKNLLPICDLRNVNIQIENKDKIFLNCDKGWLKEAFMNILKNCVEHSYNGGIVQVLFEENKLYKKITIQDRGTGISPKDLPHIFERFYKGENSSAGSIGIGLALAKAIIEKNDGCISVTSEEGKGTTFSITFLE